jgi:hypothetical protein
MSDVVTGTPSSTSEGKRPSVALDQSGLNAISQCLMNMQNDLRESRFTLALDELDYAWMRLPTDARLAFGAQPSKAISERVSKMVPSIKDLTSNSYGLDWASKERLGSVQNQVANAKTKQLCLDAGVRIVDVMTECGYYMKTAVQWHGKQDFPKVVVD